MQSASNQLSWLRQKSATNHDVPYELHRLEDQSKGDHKVAYMYVLWQAEHICISLHQSQQKGYLSNSLLMLLTCTQSSCNNTPCHIASAASWLAPRECALSNVLLPAAPHVILPPAGLQTILSDPAGGAVDHCKAPLG